MNEESSAVSLSPSASWTDTFFEFRGDRQVKRKDGSTLKGQRLIGTQNYFMNKVRGAMMKGCLGRRHTMDLQNRVFTLFCPSLLLDITI